MLSAVGVAAATPTPSLRPTPIGPGAAYRPPAAPPAVRGGDELDGLTCRGAGGRFGVHVELFAHRRVVVVPAGIGVARPFARRLGRIAPRSCTYALRTLTPTGVVEVLRAGRWSLGDLFRLWGQPLSPSSLAGFRGSPVLAFVGGRRRHGDPRSIRLTPHAQIVLELGGFVPPHPSYVFPGTL